MIQLFSQNAKLPILTFLLCVFCASPLQAAPEDWIFTKPEHGLYKIRQPQNQKETFETFPFDPGYIAYSGKSVGTIGQKDTANGLVTYSFIHDQTIGPKFSAEDLGNLIRRELKYYIAYYQNLDANAKVVKQNDKMHFGDFAAGEVYLSFDDKNVEQIRQDIRIRVVMTDVSKFVLMAQGSAKAMTSYETEDFFNTLKVYDGYQKIQNATPISWKDYTSPLGIFKMSLPEKTSIFMPEIPGIKNTPRTESMAFRFIDPVFDENIVFKIDGFESNKPVAYHNVMQLIEDRYIKKHGTVRFKDTCKQVMVDERPQIHCSYPIKPPKGYDYMTQVRLIAQFLEKDIVIQEVKASDRFINSDFVNRMLGKMTFLTTGATEPKSE